LLVEKKHLQIFLNKCDYNWGNLGQNIKVLYSIIPFGNVSIVLFSSCVNNNNESSAKEKKETLIFYFKQTKDM
jgi:hypothetical protein